MKAPSMSGFLPRYRSAEQMFSLIYHCSSRAPGHGSCSEYPSLRSLRGSGTVIAATGQRCQSRDDCSGSFV